MNVVIAGFLHATGGASPEALGAALVWKRNGLNVTWLPTWGRGEQEFETLLRGCGMEIAYANRRTLSSVPNLAGSHVVMFCNDAAAKDWQLFKNLGCKLVGVPCMTFNPQAYRRVQWDAVVCQSNYQKSALGVSDAHVIRGYYDWHNVPFAPREHVAGEPFVVGRIARDDPKKWSPDLMDIYRGIPNVQAIVMGVPASMKQQWAPIPPWCTIIPRGKQPASQVYANLHCYLTRNDVAKGGPGSIENWPRVGLEAMACGVPIIAERRGGWAEMIRDGYNGLLHNSPEHATELAKKLAESEELRMTITKQAREHLSVMCNADEIWQGWAKVFGL